MEATESRTTAPCHSSRLTRPILIAGLLGGLLGGVVSFAASRLIKPAKQEPTPTALAQATTDAREIGDAFVAKLKAEKDEEFATDVKFAMPGLTEAQFVAFKLDLFNKRTGYATFLGPTEEFEFLRETTLSPSLVRLVYLERHAGGVLWSFVLYKGTDRWYLYGVFPNHQLDNAFGGMS